MLSNLKNFGKTLLYLLGKFYHLPMSRKILHLEIMIISSYSKLLMQILPFKKFAKVFGITSQSRNLKTIYKNDLLVDNLFETIKIQSRHLPWRPTCLLQAHTAAIALRLRKLSFYTKFGVTKELSADRSLSAHAWIETYNGSTLGKENISSFSEIATFYYSPK